MVTSIVSIGTGGGCSGVQSSYLKPEFSKRCEFEPALDPHGRFLRGCLIERSEFRSPNGSLAYNWDLDHRALIDNSAISTEEAILGK